MNKLLFHEGGQPFTLNDLDFLQESIAQSLSLLPSIAPNGYYGQFERGKLKAGKVITSWSDGVVVIGKKIAPVKAGELPYKESDKFYAYIRESTGREQSFQDGSKHNTASYVEAVISTTRPQGEYVEIFSGAYLGKTYNTGYTYIKGPSLVPFGILCYADITGTNTRVIAGKYMLPPSEARGEFPDESIGDFSVDSPYNDGSLYISGGAFIEEEEYPIGSSIHLRGGKIFLVDAKGEYLRPKSRTIRFAFTQSIATTYEDSNPI